MRVVQIGSFQTGAGWESENPLEEVWSRVTQIGSREHIAKHWAAEKLSDPTAIAQISEYTNVRVRQAVEFRSAARQSSQLTSPLAFYYSFLNLLRGFYALKHESIPDKGHGLTFGKGALLLDCECVLSRGSFAAYLATEGGRWSNGHAITLRTALARIIELRDDFPRIAGQPSLVDFVAVKAYNTGEIFLDFRGAPGLDFRHEWHQAFPNLKDICELEPEGNVLRVCQSISEYEKVAEFLPTILDADLRIRVSPRWFAHRHLPAPPEMPRLGYYFVAMFILGSIVRYEPELVREIADPDREVSWLIGRFLRLAERYFPQLAINWLAGGSVYY
jgi:hypothetical protein